MATGYDLSRLKAEVAEWPGASVARYEAGRKHAKLYLSYRGQERFVVMPTTPGDARRGELNNINDVRKVLGELGAKRSQRRKATVKRCRNKPDRMPLAHIEPVGVKPDPWAALAEIKFVEPPRKGHLREALRQFAGSVRRMVARSLQAMRP